MCTHTNICSACDYSGGVIEMRNLEISQTRARSFLAVTIGAHKRQETA